MINKTKYILAIETSCDETAAAVVSSDFDKSESKGLLLRRNPQPNGQVARILAGDSNAPRSNCPKTTTSGFKILSNIIYSQIPLHQKTQGVVPEVASREQVAKIIPVISRALKKAKIQLSQIHSLTTTSGPGLIGSLLIGTETARTLGWTLKLPIIPVNHIYAHMVSPLGNTELKSANIQFPILVLTVSGGHTRLVLMKDWLDYQTIGQTHDDAAGEAFDKIASILGLPYPGGPALEKLAKKYHAKNLLCFPSPKLKSQDLNFSFSGLKTAVLYHLEKYPQTPKDQLAQAAQEAIIKVLVEKTYLAYLKYRPKTIFVTGGVSANQTLQKTIKGKFNQITPRFPPKELLTDNAAMVGIAATLISARSPKKEQLKANPNLAL